MLTRLAPRLRYAIELLTTVTVLVAAASVVWLAFNGRLGAPPGGPQPLDVGDRFEGAAELAPSRSGSALVMFLSTRCPYCTDSLGFYRTLAEMKNRSSTIVVIGTEPVEVLRAYVQSAGFPPDHIATASRAALRQLQGYPHTCAD